MKNILLLIALGLCGHAMAQTPDPKPSPPGRFYNQTEIGVGMGRNRVYGGNDASLMALTFNGYRFNQRLILGSVVGVDWYAGELITIVGAGVRGSVLKDRKSSPCYAFDAGYGGTWFTHEQDYESLRGGLMLNPMVGIKTKLDSGMALVISAGYKHQRATSVIINDEVTGWGPIYSRTEKNYNRFVMRVGLTF